MSTPRTYLEPALEDKRAIAVVEQVFLGERNVIHLYTREECIKLALWLLGHATSGVTLDGIHSTPDFDRR